MQPGFPSPRALARALALAVLATALGCVPPVSSKFSCQSNADCLGGFGCRDHVCVATADLCQNFPCGHGKCVVKNDAPACACDAHYLGAACDACAAGYQDHDQNGSCEADCATAALACSGHGSCDDASGTASCACAEGYAGADCSGCADGFQDHDQNGTCEPDCASANLSCGHGSCDDSSGTAACACATGYGGADCSACADGYQDHDSDGSCQPTCQTAALGCSGHGSCDDSSGTATCSCDPSYTGDDCSACSLGHQDNDHDGVCTISCTGARFNCGGHGGCDDSSGTAGCKCDPGYAGGTCSSCADGYQDNDQDGTCQPTCATAALGCSGHGSCADGSGTATCECDAHYAGADCSSCDANSWSYQGACYGRTTLLGSADADESVRGLALDSDGLVLAGAASGTDTTLYGGTQSLDPKGEAYVAAYDPTGKPRWAMRLTGNASKGFVALGEDPQGNYVALGGGYGQTLQFNGAHDLAIGNDAFVVGLGHDGSYRWAQHFASYGAGNAAVGPDGTFWVTGSSYDTDFGGPTVYHSNGLDAYVAGFATDGHLVWGKLLGGAPGPYGAPQEMFNGVAVDPQGNVYVVGYISAATDFGGTTLDPGTSGALAAMVVASYTPDGGLRWARMFPRSDRTDGSATAFGYEIAVDPSGIVAVAGGFRGTFDFGGGPRTYPNNTSFVADVLLTLRSSDGSYLHDRELTTGLSISVTQLEFDANHDLQVIGNINNGGADLGGGTVGEGPFWASYGSDLGYRFAKVGEVGAYPTAYGLAFGSDGSALLVGNTQHGANFGFGLVPPAGYTDIFLTWFPP